MAYRIRIEYVERANVVGDIASVQSEYLNVYFLAYGYIQQGTFVTTSTQLIIDIWEHTPEAGTKTCHQWLLVDNDVDDNVDTVYADLFTENRWNILQEVRPIPVLQVEMENYSQLFRRCLHYTLKRVGLSSISEAYRV
ncbi:MAG: hypothetical protein JSV89_15330 [Spirochaetaceae bacterium]|nr:MAG: hypothetical protein JSV89_15330 [Spirochaetaceae bacterium]